MEAHDLSSLALSLGLEVHGSRLWGLFDDYAVLGGTESDLVHMDLGFGGQPGDARMRLDSLLSERKSQSRIHDFSWSDDGRRLSLSFVESQLAGLREALGEVTAAARFNNLPSACFACGSTNEPSFFDMGGSAVHLCKDCAAKVREEESRVRSPMAYLVGAIGAIVGALVGSLAWIIIGLIGFIASIAGFAIGWASFFGYQFMKGPATPYRLAVVILATVGSLVFAEFAGMVIQLLKAAGEEGMQWGVPDALSYLPTILATPGVTEELLKNLGLGLLFAGLGTWSLFKGIAQAPAPVRITPLARGN